MPMRSSVAVIVIVLGGVDGIGFFYAQPMTPVSFLDGACWLASARYGGRKCLLVASSCLAHICSQSLFFIYFRDFI